MLFKGASTTVPCTENINLIVIKNIKHMSYNQFKKFKRWIWNNDKKYYMVEYGNARGPKRLSQRKIYL